MRVEREVSARALVQRLCLGIALTVTAGAVQGEVRIDGRSLGRLPTGTQVHESVKPEADGVAIAFSKGGITLPTAGLLTAGTGSIDVECQMPNVWPASGDRALFHTAAAAHVHVTLFFRDGVLLAVYKGGKDHFSSIHCTETGKWQPGSWHRVQFGWQAVGETDVEFLLLVDGRLAGTATGWRIATWPATCEVGVRSRGTPWQGLLRNIVLSTKPIAIPGLAPGQRTITIQADRPIGECYPFWTVANCNKPQQFLASHYVQGIAKSQPFIRQINLVYLLGGRYPDQNTFFQGLAPDGQIRANFDGMITQLKAVNEGGVRPWIVLDNVPYNMSDPPQENTYGNTAPPKDERVWGQYVEAAVRAMVEAFGPKKVAEWWFRVGTEPDLTPGHWSGTKEQYLAHYDHTVAAVRRVLPEAKIGPGNILNPAGGEFGTATRRQWGLDIIDHAARGTNAVTGGQGTPMDWFSCSWYGRVGQPLSVFDDAIGAIRHRLARYPQFAGLPVIVGEFAVLHDESGRRLWGGDTTEWAASFYAALARRVYTHQVQHVYEWAQTTSGVPHPRTQVIAMLDQMSGGKRLAVDVKATSEADCGAIAVRKGDDLFALVYNHRELRRPKVNETVKLVFQDPRMQAEATKWTLSEWQIDAKHASWAYAFEADCEAAGVHPLPTAGRYEGAIQRLYGEPGIPVFFKNRERYARLAAIPKTREAVPVAVSNGQVALDFEMEGHSVRLIRLSPTP